MNTREAADYCGVTESVLLYVARRDRIGTKQGTRWSFSFEELDRVFGGSAAFVAQLRREIERLTAELTVARALIDYQEAYTRHARRSEREQALVDAYYAVREGRGM